MFKSAHPTEIFVLVQLFLRHARNAKSVTNLPIPFELLAKILLIKILYFPAVVLVSSVP